MNSQENRDQRRTELSTPEPAPNLPSRPKINWKKIRNGCFWWVAFVGQPILFIVFIGIAIYLFGIAQNYGWFSSAEITQGETKSEASDVLYICPMVCVPPSTEPGRCPVCGMKLKPQKISGDLKDKYGLTLNKANIRIANIQTVAAEEKSLTEHMSAIGTIDYDEASLATISAYVDGRVEKLFADYTGFVVDGSCELAVLYSPELYLSQVALFQAKQLLQDTEKTDNKRILESNQRFYKSSKQRLIELGLSEEQVAEIENKGKPESRIRIKSPIEGTVVEKLVEEGEYVKTGQPIAKVADLSNVWLVLELFPKDAAKIRFGQKVVTQIQSIPNRKFEGRIAYVDTTVDTTTQSVPVRVVIPNPDGDIRIGDYATATITVDVTHTVDAGIQPIYDSDLAGKWISPRHPQIQSDQPGKCSICDMDLVPAEKLGFSPLPIAKQLFVTVPRSAVLIVGDQNVAYVETKRGRFEFREIEVDRIIGGDVVVKSGISHGELVVAKAALLLDSSFNMANKPSLIDPNKIKPETPEKEDPFADPEVIKALEKFTDAERDSIKVQEFCPVGEQILGSMGPPLKIDHEGNTIWVCCEGCVSMFKKTPSEYLQKLDELKSKNTKRIEDEKSIQSALAGLSPEDRSLAEKQEICPVSEFRLGEMGKPIKVSVNDQEIFICCEGCHKQFMDEPEKHFEYLRAYAARKKSEYSDSKSEPIPKLKLPESELHQHGKDNNKGNKSDGPKSQNPNEKLPELELPKSQPSKKKSDELPELELPKF